MAITFNNTIYQAGFSGTDDGAASNNFLVDDASTVPATVNGTVSKAGDPVTVVFNPGTSTAQTFTLYATQYDNSRMIEFVDSPDGVGNDDTTRYLFSNVQVFGTGSPNRTRFVADSNNTPGDYVVTCFTTGTLIRTANGDRAVEELHVGDLVVTTSGTRRPITWIGHRKVECARYRSPNEVLPVRIAAHAFADNRPSRDLVVSPGHSIAIDLMGEVLIPASSLVNGTTIRQENVEHVTYWHVELESHDLLLAENLPTESYLEMGNRNFFPRDGRALSLYAVPDAVPTTHADFCRPFHEAGPLVDFVRERLAARARQLEWVQVENPLAAMHLVVDGQRIEPQAQGLTARFLLPASAQSVWLVSETVVPAMAGGGADLRELGVCVGCIVINDGFEARTVAADDPRLCTGFYHVEAGPQRWTAGRALLPESLWEGCRNSFFLRVDLTRPALPRWVAPTPDVRASATALAG